jgi:hypothetical protein
LPVLASHHPRRRVCSPTTSAGARLAGEPYVLYGYEAMNAGWSRRARAEMTVGDRTLQLSATAIRRSYLLATPDGETNLSSYAIDR